MSKRMMTFVLEDHLCRHCGARVLRAVTGVGMTGGGNPVFMCSTCGKGGAAMGPEIVCWCGFQMRGQNLNAYMCVPFSALKDNPHLRQEFQSCGTDPDSQQTTIGVVTENGYRRAKRLLKNEGFSANE